MIIFISTAAHRYTHAFIAATLPGFRRMSYRALFLRRRLPVATYIFTDFDRLSFWQLELATFYHRALTAAGCRVLNDPARALHRLPLLQRLHRDGLNRFAVWPADHSGEVDRFPVFVRTDRAHRGVLTDLLNDFDALAAAVARLVQRGYPMSDLTVVEYCAEPVRDELFRKPSVYRIADCLIACPSVHQRHWFIREGNSSLATEDEYRGDLERVRDNPFGPAALAAFEAGSIDFGRADIGVVSGEPQIYEINTNPFIAANSVQHHSPLRIEAVRHSQDAYRAALVAIATPRSRARVSIGTPPAFGRGRWMGLRTVVGWVP